MGKENGLISFFFSVEQKTWLLFFKPFIQHGLKKSTNDYDYDE